MDGLLFWISFYCCNHSDVFYIHNISLVCDQGDFGMNLVQLVQLATEDPSKAMKLAIALDRQRESEESASKSRALLKGDRRKRFWTFVFRAMLVSCLIFISLSLCWLMFRA